MKQFSLSPEAKACFAAEGTLLRLRILETTDVHGNLLPYDYYADQTDVSYGLARVATLIREARSESPNCLLFDNGDFLQGTPISDLTAQPGGIWHGTHPSVAAMNLLSYDAVNLGNHEFNFGLDWLDQALDDANFPVTCSNAIVQPGRTPDQDSTLFPPYLLLHRAFVDDSNISHSICIGVIGAVPPQITTWDHFHLDGRLESRDIVETIRARIPQMRAEGADLVVVLAHSGIDNSSYRPGMENSALQLGRVEGVDVILAGHTHQVFPHSGPQTDEAIDHVSGTLHGTPAVMAGFRGSHLGVVDLELTRRDDRWVVNNHKAEARPVLPEGAQVPRPPDPSMVEALEQAHRRTLTLVSKPLGKSTVSFNSYFAMVRNDASVQLVTRAQARAMHMALTGTAYSALPILSCSTAFKTGGRAGPLFYSDVKAGPLHLRHAADLYPFPNTLCGLLMNGAQLRDWLERAAICFNRLVPGWRDQPLLNPKVAGHNFDIIDGLRYTFDLSAPARFDIAGNLLNPAAHRVVDMRYQGEEVRDGDRFVLAVNSYRAFGGGPYPSPATKQIVYAGHDSIRDLLSRYITENDLSAFSARPIWRFQPMPGSSATFDTGPGAREYLDGLTVFDAEDLGNTPDGFARFRLHL